MGIQEIFRRIFPQKEKIPSFQDLEAVFSWVLPAELQRVDWSKREKITEPSVGFTPTSLTLYQTGAYKGAKNWEAFLVAQGNVLPLVNSQGAVPPERPLNFALPPGSFFPSGTNRLYLQTAQVDIEGKTYPAGRWIFDFKAPQIGA